jgi:hypothetical protein
MQANTGLQMNDTNPILVLAQWIINVLGLTSEWSIGLAVMLSIWAAVLVLIALAGLIMVLTRGLTLRE